VNYVQHGLDLFAGYGDLEALVATDGRRFTYAEVRARIRNTAAALWRHGIRPGMTVGMLVTNKAEALFVSLGAHLLGCRNAYLMFVAPPRYLHEFLSFVEADAFVYQVAVTGELGRELAEAAAPMPTLCIGAGGLGPDLTDPPEVDELPFDPAAITQEPVSLFPSSGTTGTSKLAIHGTGLFTNIHKAADFYRPADQPRIKHLMISGVWHGGGMASALMTWFNGGLLVMQAGMDIPVFLEAIARERVTSTNMAAPVMYPLLEHPGVAEADLSSLRRFTLAGTAAPPARLRQAAALLGPALNVVYGMTELPVITTLTDLQDLPADSPLLASCGRPFGDARVEIRDPKGVPLPPGEPGEIWVRGEIMTEGYWKMPDLNAENLVDGWLRTGDVGRFDTDGYLYIMDRSKDVVIFEKGGTMVFCRPIEDTLAEHPDVVQAAVIGVPDEAEGEVVHAYAVLRSGATTSGDELRAHMLARLNDWFAPRAVEVVEAFPLTESGKIDKKALRDRYLQTVR
jgi:acyl-CoA synthetase (AMP-forming)/AMP-acid ligase II